MSEQILLPKIPSQLLRIAVDDLKKTMKDPNYIVNMYLTFHQKIWKDHEKYKENPNVCVVCFAGSVMAKTLNASIKDRLSPVKFHINTNQLYALDNARQGKWASMFSYLGLNKPSYEILVSLPKVTPFHDDPDEFLLDMEDAIKVLAENNL